MKSLSIGKQAEQLTKDCCAELLNREDTESAIEDCAVMMHFFIRGIADSTKSKYIARLATLLSDTYKGLIEK